jgi:hypothetical protein
MLLVATNSGTLIIALPDLERALRTSLLELVWVILAYMISSTVLVLTAGRLSDLFGRKTAFVGAFVIFAAASLGGGVSLLRPAMSASPHCAVPLGRHSSLRNHAMGEAELRIGAVAKLAGTTPRTIRYYEEIGLLPAAGGRKPGAHRSYAEAEVERLTELLRLKDLLGVSLEELKELAEAEGARAELTRARR